MDQDSSIRLSFDPLTAGNPWIALLAHELREPLNSVALSVGILGRVCASDADARVALAAVERGTHHMVSVVEDILDLYRCILGKQSPRTELVELKTVVACAIETLKSQLNVTGHQLIVSFPQSPVFLDAQPSHLRQVLINLLSNAAKHTGSTGIIELTAGTNDGNVVIRVCDNGIGIASDLLPYIFDLFRQGVGSHKGLGIGLALVKTLVELHSGTVEARSEGVGRGAEFIVILPIEATGLQSKA